MHKSPVPSLPHISGTLGFNHIYPPASSYRNAHPIQASAAAGAGKHKRQHSAPGQLEVRILRDRAAGPFSFCTKILHLPITLHSPLAPCPGPTSLAHTAHVCTHVPRALLTAGIEDTSLDFEIVLCKILPRMTCRGAFS